jgi:hypothetical protein
MQGGDGVNVKVDLSNKSPSEWRTVRIVSGIFLVAIVATLASVVIGGGRNGLSVFTTCLVIAVGVVSSLLAYLSKRRKERNVHYNKQLDTANTASMHSRFASRLTLRKKVVILALLLCAVIGIAALSMNTARFEANSPYCVTLDPTGCDTTVNILNDTGVSYALKQCKDGSVSCSSFDYSVNVRPNAVQEALGSTDDTPEVWVVYDQQGHTAGCLNLTYTKEYTNRSVVYPLSKMQTCDEVNDAIRAFKKKYHAF